MQVVAFGIVAAVLAITVKAHRPEIALMITVVSSVYLFFMILPLLAEALGVLNTLAAQLEVHGRYVTLVLRIIGIAYVAELGAQVCADANENAIAAKIEMAGKVMIMAAAAPIMLEILQMIVGLLP